MGSAQSRSIGRSVVSLATLMKRRSLSPVATATSATGATDEPLSPPTVATVAPVAVAEAPEAALINDPEFSPSDLDRWCWPAGDAMNGAEIEMMLSRTAIFLRRGLTLEQADLLADALMKRDRDEDDRRLCLECSHLRGRTCGRATAAGMGSNVTSTVRLLQRCPAFHPVGGL